MPTPSEQKALAFFAFIILIGGAVRMVRAGSPRPPGPEEEQALAAQVQAVGDAGARSGRGRTGGSTVASVGRDDGAAGANPKGSGRRRKRAGTVPMVGAEDTSRAGWVNGYPPPSPRIDRPDQQPAPEPSRRVSGGLSARIERRPSPDSGTVIDLDVANAREIDALPRVGPAMAARIVANRDSFGRFGSLEGLGRVRGIGDATLRRLAGRVSFSGRAASLSAGSRRH